MKKNKDIYTSEGNVVSCYNKIISKYGSDFCEGRDKKECNKIYHEIVNAYVNNGIDYSDIMCLSIQHPIRTSIFKLKYRILDVDNNKSLENDVEHIIQLNFNIAYSKRKVNTFKFVKKLLKMFKFRFNKTCLDIKNKYFK